MSWLTLGSCGQRRINGRFPGPLLSCPSSSRPAETGKAMKDLADCSPVNTGWVEQDRIARASQALMQRELGDATGALPPPWRPAWSCWNPVPPTSRWSSAKPWRPLSAGQPEAVGQLLTRVDALRPVQLIPMLEAEAARARGRLAEHQGQSDPARQWFKRSIDRFRELGATFHQARAQLQLAEFLGPGDESRLLADEAAQTLAVLSARPWLARARALGSPALEPVAPVPAPGSAAPASGSAAAITAP